MPGGASLTDRKTKKDLLAFARWIKHVASLEEIPEDCVGLVELIGCLSHLRGAAYVRHDKDPYVVVRREHGHGSTNEIPRRKAVRAARFIDDKCWDWASEIKEASDRLYGDV